MVEAYGFGSIVRPSKAAETADDTADAEMCTISGLLRRKLKDAAAAAASDTSCLDIVVLTSDARMEGLLSQTATAFARLPPTNRKRLTAIIPYAPLSADGRPEKDIFHHCRTLRELKVDAPVHVLPWSCVQAYSGAHECSV